MIDMQHICFNCFQPTKGHGACVHCGYDPATDAGSYPNALPHGTVLGGKFIVGRVLGQGGFGITYKAFDPTLENMVAIKEYLPEMMATRTQGNTQVSVYTGSQGDNFQYGVSCFLDEARILAKLSASKSIVAVRSFFEENQTAYFVMDYVAGISFKSYIQNHGGKIPIDDALRIMLPVIDGLRDVHSQGIIHRDVTPDNIYITGDDQVKLLDFGSARYSMGDRSKSLDVILKPGFAPKEQYMRRGRQGPYTDVYSVAACIYAAITGYLPQESLERMEHDALLSPTAAGVALPPSVEAAILKGLAVQPEHRFQDMQDFSKALTQDDAGFTQQPIPAAASATTAAPTAPPPTPYTQQPAGLADEPPAEHRPPAYKIPLLCAGILVAAAMLVFLIGKNLGTPTSPFSFAASGKDAVTEAMAQSPPAGEVVSTDTETPGDTSSADETSAAAAASDAKPIQIEASYDFLAILRSDGTVTLLCDEPLQITEAVSAWTGVTEIACTRYGIAALLPNGQVEFAGESGDAAADFDTSAWQDIVQIAAAEKLYGVKADGTVVVVGDTYGATRRIDDWENILQISAAPDNVVGLCSDGSYVVVGDLGADLVKLEPNESFANLSVLAAGDYEIAGIGADGMVYFPRERSLYSEMDYWNRMVEIIFVGSPAFGLKDDGSVVACRTDSEYDLEEIAAWTGIRDIAALPFLDGVAALGSDGAIYVQGDANSYRSFFYSVQDWNDSLPSKWTE